jgi:hypothetical protein
MATKVDFKRTFDGYKAKRGVFRVLDLPELRYLMIDGSGDPNTSPNYTSALEALYPVAYKLKFASKVDLGRDYVVPPLEGLWWADDLSAFTTARNKNAWQWTLLLLVPDWIEQQHIDAAIEAARKAKQPERLDDLRCESLTEGRCVQTLHVGPFDEEADVLAELHDVFVPDNGYRLTGTHHEVYLSDPRRTAPAKLRTILRQPVTTAD